LAIKNLDLDPDPFPDSPKTLDTDPYSIKMDPNTDYNGKPTLKFLPGLMIGPAVECLGTDIFS
jgi:hypothetical protein